jgi:hypothetical protein
VRVLPTEEGEKCADFLGGSAQMSQSQWSTSWYS